MYVRATCFGVMPGPVPGIHAFRPCTGKDVDGRHKAGHDE